MTINEQFKDLKSHIDEEDIVEFFVCLKDWANTDEGTLLDQYNVYDDGSFFEHYGELESFDWCVLMSEYVGLGVGFVVKETC